MVNKSIAVFEHSRLMLGEQGFQESHYNALVKFNDLHGGKYFTPGHRRITFKSYVGVVQAGNLVIEILPKADRQGPKSIEQQISKWQSALIYMLKKAGYLNVTETEKANLRVAHGSLLDVYLYTFLEDVDRLIHNGLVKKYRSIRKNNTALKGRLLIEKQIQFNTIHQELFFTEHTTYDRNNVFNGVLKRALEIISDTNINHELIQKAKHQLFFFDNIDCWCGNLQELEKLPIDRKTRDYMHALDLAKMIIGNYCPDLSAGRKNIIAILFDMNRLFEKFIYRLLKEEEKSFTAQHLTINRQKSLAFWRHRTIRPDILIRYQKDADEKNGTKTTWETIVVDTKWKVIKSDEPGDPDLKQMYVYNLQFGAARSVLLFPSTAGQVNSGTVNYVAAIVKPAPVHGCELYFARLFEASETRIDPRFAHAFLDYLISAEGSE